MQKRQIESARKTLLERERELARRNRTTLEAEAALLGAQDPEVIETATNQAEAGNLERVGANRHAALVRVQAALARIEAGSYGTCLVCGQSIPAARLRLVPEAERCTPCSTVA